MHSLADSSFSHCNDTYSILIAQSPASSKNNISKKGERRLGKGVSSIDTTVGTASSNKPKTKSTTSKSLVSDILDVGILSNHEDTEFDEVFTWVDHDAAPTHGRDGGRRRHGRKGGGHRNKRNQNLSRHKDELLAKLHGSKVSQTNNDINVIDTGILQVGTANMATSECLDEDDFIECEGGYVKGSDNSVSCESACDGKCCVGVYEYEGETYQACDGFTGKVCKDSISCVGIYSCYYATVDSVANGCYGDFACDGAAAFGGSIGNITSSCHGKSACKLAASFGGSIEGIKESCLDGEDSCANAAAGYINDDFESDGGSIGMIESSCIGDSSCYKLAYYDGNVGDVSMSCEGENACGYAAMRGGIIGGIEESCLDDSSCLYTAAGYCYYNYITYAYECESLEDSNVGGNIGMLKSSCVEGESVCDNLAGNSGTIGDVVESCDGFFSCSGAASYGGRIESITNSSCSGSNACSYAASCDAYENDNCKAGRIGNITSSCDEEKSCYKMAYEGGYVSNVLSSCLGISSCERAAFNGSISDGIEDACLGKDTCKSLGENSTIDGAISGCCLQPGGCKGLTYLPLCCVNATDQNRALQSCPGESTLPPSKAPSSSPSMSPLPPTPSAKSKGRKSKQSKKSKSAKASSMNLTTSDEDDSKIRRKRIRKHAPGASGKLPSLSKSDEQ